MNFKATASTINSVLDYLSFLRVALNSWVSNYVDCFTFEAVVCPVAVDIPRDSPPGRYTLPLVREASSPRKDTYFPDGSRARYAPPSG